MKVTSSGTLIRYRLCYLKTIGHRLKQGLKQRTALLNKIQQDIYGEQKLLMNGQFLHSNYFKIKITLREGFSLPSNELTLFFTAVDLYRTPQVEFKVLADHCQCPLGLGLLLKAVLLQGV